MSVIIIRSSSQASRVGSVKTLTLIANVVTGLLALGARNGLLICLSLERRAAVARTLAVHGSLEGIALPAE